MAENQGDAYAGAHGPDDTGWTGGKSEQGAVALQKRSTTKKVQAHETPADKYQTRIQSSARAVFYFSLVICCAVFMISLEMAMKPLHGGDTCPYGWEPYTTTSRGSPYQCHVVFGFGIFALLVGAFLLAFEVAMLRGDGVLIRLTPVLGQLVLIIFTMFCLLGVAAMCEAEFVKLCDRFLHDSPRAMHASNCADAIQDYSSIPAYRDEGVGSLHRHLDDVTDAAWASVILLFLTSVLLLVKYGQLRKLKEKALDEALDGLPSSVRDSHVPDWAAGDHYDIQRRKTYDNSGRVPDWVDSGATALAHQDSPAQYDDEDIPEWAREGGSSSKSKNDLNKPLLAE